MDQQQVGHNSVRMGRSIDGEARHRPDTDQQAHQCHGGDMHGVDTCKAFTEEVPIVQSPAHPIGPIDVAQNEAAEDEEDIDSQIALAQQAAIGIDIGPQAIVEMVQDDPIGGEEPQGGQRGELPWIDESAIPNLSLARFSVSLKVNSRQGS